MGNRPQPLPVRAGVWAVFLVLAGLVAMHGIGSHGTMSASHAAAPMPSHAGHGSMATEQVVSAPVLAPKAPPAAIDYLAGGCLVVLGLALMLLLGLGSVGARGRYTSALNMRASTVLPRARAPDPPDLLVLSICRC